MRLVADQVTFCYPGASRPVLAGVSFDVPSGTTAAIMGPSGAGKTTFVSLLGGLLTPQNGEFHGVSDAGTRHPLPTVCTWVLQTVSLLPERTVVENVHLGGFLDGAPRAQADERARKALELVGLDDRAGDACRVLSGGEAQRVAVARALTSRRPVLLADEPTGNLDAQTTEQVLDALFAAVAGDTARRTVVLVTHDPAVAARCDVTYELRSGRLVPVAARQA
ncbi:ATP-binding cassette domain-containing protein [Actinotalea ferrariae]|uniref:ABC transporter ATP-binding protein n=1 Tax=Actinotalea ferrariae TaxID=1386098 RepID=UPI001C8B9FEC|nr:ATP-binding cassette domain-containing protein [Actinotalea ferrariae]MBX9246713.1 ATP-binding cassette domain-containing protein [Actinotalea ferrariae]